MPSPRRTIDRHDARRLIAEHCLVPTTPASSTVGIELEFLTFLSGDRSRRPDLTVMQSAAGAAPVASRVTFEPGGQVELSSPPCQSAAAAIDTMSRDAAALTQTFAAVGVELMAIGHDRWRPPVRLLDAPRYRAMEAHFDRGGREGRVMMCNTASLQINVDTGVGERRWHAAHALGPALVAAFANSPADGWKSRRLAAWRNIDASRTSPVRAQDGDVCDAWADYALAATAFVRTDGEGGCRPLPGAASLGRWLDTGVRGVGFLDADDIALHLTTLFPPVRPRRWLELRYLDALPSPWWETAVMVTTALLDDALVDEAVAAVAGTEALWAEAARFAMDHDGLAAAAARCFELALAATGDGRVAEYLERFVARRVPAWA